MYPRIVKPVFDIFFAVVSILVSLPFFLLLLPVLMFTNGGDIFYYAERTGLKGKTFRMIKFKTMKGKREDDPLPDRERVTAIGRFLRMTSLDELPQLLNVLKRDMSLIGPRPLPTAYMDEFTGEQRRRLDVLPGITGWAQVNGRHAIPWRTKFDLDVYYVDNLSLWLDTRILLMTAIVLLSFKKDISLEEQPFKGN
jgi:lipopolysaccharide/colanic/teichoic acid biosynthesis glycosyltransferase